MDYKVKRKYSDHLEHAWFTKGVERNPDGSFKNHKYIARIKKNGKWLYIYTQSQLNKAKGIVNNTVKKASTIVNRTTNSARKTVNTLSTKAKTTATKVTRTAQAKSTELQKTAQKVTKTAVAKAQKSVNTAKNTVKNTAQKTAQKVETQAKQVVNTVKSSDVAKTISTKFGSTREELRNEGLPLDKALGYLFERKMDEVSRELSRNAKNIAKTVTSVLTGKFKAKDILPKQTKEVKPFLEDDDGTWYETTTTRVQMLEVNPKWVELKSEMALKEIELNNKDAEGTLTWDDEIDYMKLYDEYLPYAMNCPNCTLALDLRERGYDVKAIDNTEGATVLDIVTWYEGASTKDIEWYFSETSSPKDAIKYMEKQGDNASGHLFISWANGDGHDVYYKVEKGTAVIYDAQVHARIEASNYFRMYENDITDCGVFRTDNKEPSIMAIYQVDYERK